MNESSTCTIIPVRDMARCTAFLRDELGLVVSHAGDGWTRFSTRGGDVVLQKRLQADGDAATSGSRFGLGVDNLADTYRRLCSRSVHFKLPPEPFAFGRRATLVDPEGNEIDLIEWSEPAEEDVISSGSIVNDILAKSPEAMEVLEEHGIRICGGCIVLLNGTVQETAEYSGLLPAEASTLVAELNLLQGRKSAA